VVYSNVVMCNGMQWYAKEYSGTHWEACDGIGVAWSPGDYSDSPLAHRDEFHGAVHSSKIDLRLEYHHMSAKEKESHMFAPILHYDLLVMPLGLTNTLVIFQSYRKWQRYLLLLFDALIIYNRTWEVHSSQLDETSGIVAVTESFDLDHAISAHSA
jgi:hypothetical protein